MVKFSSDAALLAAEAGTIDVVLAEEREVRPAIGDHLDAPDAEHVVAEPRCHRRRLEPLLELLGRLIGIEPDVDGGPQRDLAAIVQRNEGAHAFRTVAGGADAGDAGGGELLVGLPLRPHQLVAA